MAKQVLEIAALHGDPFACVAPCSVSMRNYRAAVSAFRASDYDRSVLLAIEAIEWAVGEFHDDYRQAVRIGLPYSGDT